MKHSSFQMHDSFVVIVDALSPNSMFVYVLQWPNGGRLAWLLMLLLLAFPATSPPAICTFQLLFNNTVVQESFRLWHLGLCRRGGVTVPVNIPQLQLSSTLLASRAARLIDARSAVEIIDMAYLVSK